MIAIIDAYRAGLLKFQHLRSNLLAGLIVGVVALPLAMAFAIASGVKPEQGLYTAIIAAFMVGILGGTRTQIAGPTGAFVIILAGITAEYGVEGLQIATLLAGIMLVVMGFIKLGNIVKCIPNAVIIGFTSGIGVIIFMGEWKDFFGLTVTLPIDAHFYEKIKMLGNAMGSADVATMGLAFLSIALILLTPKFLKNIPGPLVALLGITLLQAIFQFQHVATMGSVFGSFPSHLPSFQLPAMSFELTLELLGPAFTIALLGAIESLLSARAADAMTGLRHHSNQELVAQGLANIVCPLFGGFAATGAIARTATNIRHGGNSPLAAVTHSAFLLLVIIIMAPLAAYIPLCVLAAILMIVAYHMSDVKKVFQVIKIGSWQDILVLSLTFFLTIFVNLVVAVFAGVILFFVLRGFTGMFAAK